MEELTRRIVNKLLHDPVQMLRKGDELHGAPSKYLHALDRLFRLSDRPDDVETDREDLT
jgi:glutamyl-tRNA reductase